MRWLKRGMWKFCIAFAVLLFLLVLLEWVPLFADAHEGTSGLATPVTATVQATPKVDLTITALAKEQLRLQVNQLQNQIPYQNNWLVNNSTALIAAVATVIVALFGISQWAINRRDERRKEIAAQDKELKDRQVAQDKDLRAQAEERFKAAVTALGDEKEGTQVGGAVLLRSFLNKEDEEIYGRYYTQIFDLAVAYLRLSSMSQLPEDPERLPPTPGVPLAPLPLTPLRQALIVVFQEAFPLSRNRLSQIKSALEARSLDASYIRLDGAYLARVDLQNAWMRDASFIGANLHGTHLRGSDLIRADFHRADLDKADLTKAILRRANLTKAILTGEVHLIGADLHRADLTDANLHQAALDGADLSKAILTGANLIEADLYGADLTDANLHQAALDGAILEGTILKGTDLRGVKGKTTEQLEAYKAKGAIIDEDTTVSSSQPIVTPPPPSQSDDAQA